METESEASSVLQLLSKGTYKVLSRGKRNCRKATVFILG
jgi:hypothetical protein